jgi:hypothetical protein
LIIDTDQSQKMDAMSEQARTPPISSKPAPSGQGAHEIEQAVDRVLNIDAISTAMRHSGLARDSVRRQVMVRLTARWSDMGADEERLMLVEDATQGRPAPPSTFTIQSVARASVIAYVVALATLVASVAGVTSLFHLAPWQIALVAVWGFTSVASVITLAVRRLHNAGSLTERAFDQALHERAAIKRRLDAELVLPAVRDVINEQREPRFSYSLKPLDASGLGDLSDSEYDVPTHASEQLTRTLGELKAGSLGISGQRGAGKSTLLKAAAEGRLSWQKTPLGVVVAAPVRYDPREFVPHLFAQLCMRVLEPLAGVEELRGARAERARAQARLGWTTLAIAAVGLLGYTTARIVTASSQTTEIVYSAGAGVVATIAIFACTSVLRASIDEGEEPDDSIESEARENLRALRFLATRTREIGAELSFHAATVTGATGISLAEQAWTLPEMTDRYQCFLSRITQERPVVIGIDELDKIASAEDAASFLNDIKSLFGRASAYYLVSLSDDAMAAFEHRGLPLRDTFESVFDDVLRVEPLSLKESIQLLNRRVIDMAPPFPALCHALSGGLPRELIRIAREAVRCAERTSIPHLAVISRDLVSARATARKCAAEIVVARADELIEREPLLEWLREIQPQGDARRLLAQTPARELVERLHSAGGETNSQLALLVAELTAAWYHSASVMEFFTQVDERSYAAASDPRTSVTCSLDLLARASLDLSISPQLAWGTTNRFRERVGLSTEAYPL